MLQASLKPPTARVAGAGVLGSTVLGFVELLRSFVLASVAAFGNDRSPESVLLLELGSNSSTVPGLEQITTSD